MTTAPATMHCDRCGADTWPVGDLQPNGQVWQICPKCQAPMGDAPPQTQAEAIPAPVIPIRPAIAPAARPAPATSLDWASVVAAAPARLAELDAIFASLPSLRSERAHLRRIVGRSQGH